MKQKPAKKLELRKKTISTLNVQEAKAAQGGTFGSIIYVSAGCVSANCGSDFTRPGTIIIIRP
ncbi:MAG: class I lanthipeptide [Dinghuibacter sp.]|nr:class I lanthipeptide [Dinghuibacter sp.]